MATYGKKASEEVKKAVHKQKKGTLKSRKTGKKVRAASKPSRSVSQRQGKKAPKYQRRSLPRKVINKKN